MEMLSLLENRGVLVAVAAVVAHFVYYSSRRASSSKIQNTHPVDASFWMSLSYICLFVFSHIICYYLWWAAEFNQGELGNPFPLQPLVIEKATPNVTSATIYFTIILSQLLFSYIMPGVTVLGFKIPQEDNRRLRYLCNGLAGWYTSVACALMLHYTNLFDLKLLFQHSGAMLSTAILFSDVIAVIMYVLCCVSNKSDGTITTFPHDFVMGQYLNPRLWIVDLKMWAEIRVSWLLLFALDVSCALNLKEELGYIPNRMYVILLIHGLYTNACMKGEESIPYTWDIFQECWGWMLIYWNLAGVAFAYTFNGRFIYAQRENLEELPTWAFVAMALGVVFAYWVFDESQAQKNRFRAQKLPGAYVERPWALPQMPYGTLKDPVYMTTKNKSTLLIDGWWKHVRKPHYTADLCLALLLCLPCGFTHFLPYFFFCFFLPMLVHRAMRDNARCAEKYGKDWDEYCKKVPYIFVPGVY